MDESADKGGFPAAEGASAPSKSDETREEFDRFFGKVPARTAEELAQSFEYAAGGTQESEIFERAEPAVSPEPAAQPQAEPAAPEVPRPTVRIPGAEDIQALDFQQATHLIETATQVYDVTDALLGYARGLFERAALFVSRAPWIEGWDASGNGWSRGMIRKLEISLEEPSIFGIFQRGAGYYLGPIPKTPANDEFVRITGGKRPRNCLIVPVLVGNRIVNLLYADNGHASELAADFSQIMPVLQTVGNAYERLIRSGE